MVTRRVTQLKLTKRSIDSFTYRGGWDVRWDDAVPGLGVRIYGSGKKAFVLSYRMQGRKRLIVLGRYGADLTLAQARDKARKLRVDISEGRDPLEKKRRDGQGSTFGDLMQAYIDGHAKAHKKTWHDDRKRLARHVPASWRSRLVESITPREIAELHHRIGKTTPYEANRLQEILRKMFGLARTWGFLEATAINPAVGIERFKERARKRWITPAELPKLAEAIEQENSIYVRAILWLLLLSGARKSELLGATWEDVDWSLGRLRLSDTKSGDEQFLSMSAPALAILQALPRNETNLRIFPGDKGGQMTTLDAAWRRIRSVANLEDLQIHDLRRTTGSWLSQSGVDLNTIKDALRHVSISTTLTYARLGADPAREAMEAHGQRLMKAAGRPRLLEGGQQKA